MAVHASCDGRPVVLNERELRPLRTTIKLLPGAGALVAGSVSDYSSLALRVAAEPAAGASGRWEKA